MLSSACIRSCILDTRLTHFQVRNWQERAAYYLEDPFSFPLSEGIMLVTAAWSITTSFFAHFRFFHKDKTNFKVLAISVILSNRD